MGGLRAKPDGMKAKTQVLSTLFNQGHSVILKWEIRRMLPQNFKWLSPYEMTMYILCLFNLMEPSETCERFPSFYKKSIEELNLRTIFYFFCNNDPSESEPPDFTNPRIHHI